MAIGTGKYDALCTGIRERTGADAVMLIIIGGNRGDGFSLQAADDVLGELPLVLRDAAAQLEIDVRITRQGGGSVIT